MSFDINTEIGVSGHYTLSVSNAETGEVREELDFPNMILDSGLIHLTSMSVDTACDFCHVGLGNTPVLPTQTGLASYLASTNTWGVGNFTYVPGEKPYMERQYQKVFPVGRAVGNLAEVGFGPAGAGPIFSRALIRDANGNPTTLTVLAGEILTVTYRVRYYLPLGDVVRNLDINGTTYSVRTFCRHWSQYDKQIAWFEQPWVVDTQYSVMGECRVYTEITDPGGPASAPVGTWHGYGGNYLWENTAAPADGSTTRVRWWNSQPFWGTIQLAGFDIAWLARTACPIQTVQITPPLPVLATQRLAINTSVTFSRYAP